MYRGVKLVADKMVGIDDQAITSSDSEFTASSGDEDIFELYEWSDLQEKVVDYYKTKKSL